MRRLNYQEAIKESVEELVKLEKAQQDARLGDRMRLLRYLKEGKAVGQRQAGELVGLSRRHSQKLWKQYTTHGIDSLLLTHYKGSWSKLDSQQQARLLQRLDSGDICTQAQLIDWLEQEMGIRYSQGGLSMLLTRLKVKLKTGRPVNVRKDVAGEQAFKKTSRT
jgi:transposase